MIRIQQVNFLEITNSLDEKYFDLISKIYSDSNDKNERRNKRTFLCSEVGDMTLEEAGKIGSSYIHYENRKEETFAFIKWVLSISRDGDKIVFEPNEQVYTFLEEYNMNLEDLF